MNQESNNKKMLLYITSAILISFMGLMCISILGFIKPKAIDVVDSFEECAATGAPIMESYPEQCRYNGKTYTRELTQEEKNRINPPSYPQSYYGSSTNGACVSKEDCIVMGCNSEICGSANDEQLASICIYPDEPLPKALGLTCGCVEQKCMWAK